VDCDAEYRERPDDAQCCVSTRSLFCMCGITRIQHLACEELLATEWLLGYQESKAGVAQLVERDLPKVDVVGSNPIARSKRSRKACRGSISAARSTDAALKPAT
jgi:hypothetical protein